MHMTITAKTTSTMAKGTIINGFLVTETNIAKTAINIEAKERSSALLFRFMLELKSAPLE
ncbi:hypothetical protein HY497_01175 [Candidatus Woesearchaeota archaeon]|nr:hypothetical protein [Candidatus Woesearchaeota archaeon]